MLQYLSVGYILKPQGIKGEIKVEPLTDYIERFDELDTLYIKEGINASPSMLLLEDIGATMSSAIGRL